MGGLPDLQRPIRWLRGMHDMCNVLIQLKINFPLSASYSDSDFTKTNTQNTTMTFVYNGTDVTLYGAQRGNHGNYQVTVDGVASSPQSGYNANGNFQVVLYESNGLSQGNHTVVIENLGDNLYLDIDFV